ncbi:hypothetical protein K2X30_14705 [bacterium]|nr:hypothetical protein [bacterium]
METTAIGSLPHHNIDSALEYAFGYSIPFLPQIPLRNPWEYMIPQALEGLPGLEAEGDGATFLNVSVWVGRCKAFQEKMDAAFSSNHTDAFSSFEPTAATWSSWQPFLWELEERGVKTAKIQIAGPLTSQWSIRTKDGTSPDQHPEIGSQIFRLILARSIAMSRRLLSAKIQPLLYLDEPGLYAFDPTNPRHILTLNELKLLIAALKKEGVLVGLHCCSNTHWESVLGLGLNVLSIDTRLSLTELLKRRDALQGFYKKGGRLSLGVIPSERGPELVKALHAPALFSQLQETFADTPHSNEILRSAIYTPACGLAFHSTEDTELIRTELERLRSLPLTN